ALRVAARMLANGARVIDAGIDQPGGYGAGLALARICMGGLGDVEYVPVPIADEAWPGVRVWTDHPAVSCMAAQYAGWAIQVEKYFAMGSGPLRAHARVEKELFQKLGYRERARRGVLVLETRTPPTAARRATPSPPTTASSPSSCPGSPRPPRKTMARRSTTSSNGTTVISTRSIRCSSVPPRCGSRARGAARRITPVARTPTCCARRSSRAETRALTHPPLTQGAILMHCALLSRAAPAALALLAACARPQPA